MRKIGAVNCKKIPQAQSEKVHKHNFRIEIVYTRATDDESAAAGVCAVYAAHQRVYMK